MCVLGWELYVYAQVPLETRDATSFCNGATGTSLRAATQGCWKSDLSLCKRNMNS